MLFFLLACSPTCPTPEAPSADPAAVEVQSQVKQLLHDQDVIGKRLDALLAILEAQP